MPTVTQRKCKVGDQSRLNLSGTDADGASAGNRSICLSSRDVEFSVGEQVVRWLIDEGSQVRVSEWRLAIQLG